MKLVYKADMHRIQQIVMNIVRNSINDASAESSISLKLKINKKEDDSLYQFVFIIANKRVFSHFNFENLVSAYPQNL